jgi:hypothetical protein
MARKPTVWFREQTGSQYTTLNGKKICLTKGKKAAEKALHTLPAQPNRNPPTPPTSACSGESVGRGALGSIGVGGGVLTCSG